MLELQVYFEDGAFAIPKEIYSILLALSCVGFVSLIIWKGWKEGTRYSVVLLFVEWVFLIFGTALLFRDASAERGYSLMPFISYWEYGEKSYFMERFAINLLNVALFVPVGLLVGLGFRNISWKRVLQLGFFLSLTIEILQFIFKKGYAEVDDIIHNVVGCLIGYGICSLLTKTTTILTKTKTKTKTARGARVKS